MKRKAVQYFRASYFKTGGTEVAEKLFHEVSFSEYASTIVTFRDFRNAIKKLYPAIGAEHQPAIVRAFHKFKTSY